MRRPARAFTILELALSVMVMAVLMTAMGSAVLLASKAIPPTDAPGVAAIAQSRALEMLTADLGEAVHFSERETTAITLAVPDRDGDGSPELIRYAWGGSAGDPLTRQVNGGAERTIAGDIQSLVFSTVDEVVTETLPAALVDGAEQIVAAYTTSGSTSTIGPEDPQAIGQAFQADLLPTGTLAWRMTAIELRAQQDGSGGCTLALQLRNATAGGQPDATPIVETTFSESELSSGSLAWSYQPLDAYGLDPAATYAALLFDVGSGKGGQFEIESGGDVNESGEILLTGNDADGWTTDTGKSLIYRIHGVPQTLGSPVDVTREHIAAVEVDASGPVPMRSRATVPNAPQTVRAHWSLSFDHNPTAVDANTDGSPDWQTSDASAFNTATLGSGLWNASQTIVSIPRLALDTPVTLTARLRDTTESDGSAAGVLLAVDRDGFEGADLRLHVERTAADQQQVVLSHQTPSGERALARTAVPTRALFDVRLVIAPAERIVHLSVDGESIGSYQYQRYSTTDNGRIELSPIGGAGAQFDELTVRVNP